MSDSTDNPNPYASPSTPAADLPTVDPNAGRISTQDARKIAAIIKDASQWWLAIILCLFCTAVGMIVVGPWYGFRLVSWHSFAKKYPFLLEANPLRGSTAYKFQSAKWKLLCGLIIGLFLAGLVFIGLVLPVLFVA